MIEMIATISLLGILLAMAFGALTYYFSIKSLDTSAKELTTQIREAQAMALSSGNRYRIEIDVGASDDTYMLQQWQGTWVDVRGPISLEGGVKFAASSSIEFTARGTCAGGPCDAGGQLVIEERFGRSKALQVDGETVNVRVS